MAAASSRCSRWCRAWCSQPPAEGPGQFSVNGQRSDTNYFTVDGVSANFGSEPGCCLGQSLGGAIPGFTSGGGTNSLVSVDAMQEFRIQTSSYAPEFGRTPGGWAVDGLVRASSAPPSMSRFSIKPATSAATS